MALDGLVISALTYELSEKLVGCRIDKIHQPERDEIMILVRGYGCAYRLLLCANPSFPRIHLSSYQKENPTKPPMFCMLLRKHLSGGKILSISQDGFERVVKIAIESYDEMGYLSQKTLIIEIMGKHSNIILIDSSGKILDSIIHVDVSVSSVRLVLPALMYERAPSQGKKDPAEQSREDIENTLCTSDVPLWKQILDSYTGISPIVAREAVYRALGECDISGEDAGFSGIQKVAVNFAGIMADVKDKNFKPRILSSTDTSKLVDFSVIDIAQYGSAVEVQSFDSINDAIESFYAQKANSENIRQRAGDLLKFLSVNLERCRKKLQLQSEILKKAAKRDKYKIYGDLITANIYRIKEGDKEAVVENFYSDNNELVTIPLKTDLTPAKNAQRYYLKYNKEKTAEAETLKQKKLNEEEIDYLQSVTEAVHLCETPKEVTQIRDELIEGGYLKNKGRLNKKSKDVARPLHFVSKDGYDIYVGKNNKQNDYVTLKLSERTDIWFHTKGIHGSHVLVKTKDAMQVPDQTYLEAAELAAYYSKARNSESVPVDYTEVKNVKKPSGAKPGMVIYVSYNTLYVKPKKPTDR